MRTDFTAKNRKRRENHVRGNRVHIESRARRRELNGRFGYEPPRVWNELIHGTSGVERDVKAGSDKDLLDLINNKKET